jgi:uncharacterized protein YdhG (YjbR/CyaY superfamily)
MFQGKARTVAEYLSALPEDRRKVVSKLRSFVKKHLPKGYKEQIGWGVITYAVPLETLADTYNGEPLCYTAIAAQKNHYSLYLMGVYGDAKKTTRLAEAYRERGQKLDMGKACLRFRSLDEVPLDVVGEIIASVPMDRYVELYKVSRAKGAKGANGVKGAKRAKRA